MNCRPPSTSPQARVLLAYLHHFADTDKDGCVSEQELLRALAPFR